MTLGAMLPSPWGESSPTDVPFSSILHVCVQEGEETLSAALKTKSRLG